MQTLTFASIIILSLLAKVAFDRYLIQVRKVRIRHGLELAVIMFIDAIALVWIYGLQPVTIGVGAVAVAFWWPAFNYSINKANNWESWYIGKTSEIDKYLRIEPKWQFRNYALLMSIAITILLITLNL